MVNFENYSRKVEAQSVAQERSEKIYRLGEVSGNAPLTPSCVFVLMCACLLGFYLLFSITVSCEYTYV